MQKVNTKQKKYLIFESLEKRKKDEKIKKIEKIEKQNNELLKKVKEMLKTSEADEETIEWVREGLDEMREDEMYEEQEEKDKIWEIEDKLSDLIEKRKNLESYRDELGYNNETPKERIEIERENRNLIYEIIRRDYRPVDYLEWDLEKKTEFLEKESLIEEILESAFLLKKLITEKEEVMREQEKSIYNNMIKQLLIKIKDTIKD